MAAGTCRVPTCPTDPIPAKGNSQVTAPAGSPVAIVRQPYPAKWGAAIAREAGSPVAIVRQPCPAKWVGGIVREGGSPAIAPEASAAVIVRPPCQDRSGRATAQAVATGQGPEATAIVPVAAIGPAVIVRATAIGTVAIALAMAIGMVPIDQGTAIGMVPIDQGTATGLVVIVQGTAIGMVRIVPAAGSRTIGPLGARITIVQGSATVE